MATYKLLTGNFKLSKRTAATLHLDSKALVLAPADLSGYEVCHGRSNGCTMACVMHFAGHMVQAAPRAAQIRRTKLLFEQRELFLRWLCDDLSKFARKCAEKLLRPCVRLNAASDLNWFEIARLFPQITFYDYSKILPRFRDPSRPSNYHLTYSISENSKMSTTRQLLQSGINCAVVVDVRYTSSCKRFGPLPRFAQIDGERFDVVDGDIHDFRLSDPDIDGTGNVIGLRLKGGIASKQTAISAGFARSCSIDHSEYYPDLRIVDATHPGATMALANHPSKVLTVLRGVQ